MPGTTGSINIVGMRNRRKGGATAPPSVPPPPAASLRAHAEAFLQHLAARAYSTGTIEAHQWALKGFLEWADSQHLTTPGPFTRATLEAYQLYLHHYRSPRTKEPLVINTQLGRLGAVRRFFAWLCRSGTLPANPAADLDLPRKQSRRLPKALTPEELDRLFSQPNPADPMGLRDRTILELFYATGIRRTEMTQLDPGDYDPHAQTLLIRHGKGDKSRLLPVGGRASFWLDRFLAEARPLFDHLPNETAMFLSGYGTRITPAYLGTWVAGQMKKAGVTKPGACHLLRHSMATDMHCNGADIRHVQEMLGHARLETTQIYTHVNIKVLAAVHARTHPHGTLPKDHEHGCREPEVQQAIDALATAPQDAQPAMELEVLEVSACRPEAAVVFPGAAMPAALANPISATQTVPKPPGPDEDPPETGPAPPPKRPPPPTPENPFNLLTSNGLPHTDPATNGGHVAYYGYRWYDPLTGRWPSRDPIEEDGGVNLYGFVENNGVGKIDLLGLDFYCFWSGGSIKDGSDCKPPTPPQPPQPSIPKCAPGTTVKSDIVKIPGTYVANCNKGSTSTATKKVTSTGAHTFSITITGSYTVSGGASIGVVTAGTSWTVGVSGAYTYNKTFSEEYTMTIPPCKKQWYEHVQTCRCNANGTAYECEGLDSFKEVACEEGDY